MKSAEIQEKARATCMEKYGELFYTRTGDYKKEHAARNLEKMLERIKTDPEVEYLDFSEFNQISSTAQIWNLPITCKCRLCGTEFKKNLGFNNYYKYGTVSSCPKCHPTSSTSKDENDIFQFIRECVGDEEIVRNSRGVVPHFEIDIYVPSRKFAVEFDGLYWHSSKNGIPADYHLKKTEACLDAGIRLIHVFENEWHFKKDIVKSRLADMLGIRQKTVYARKCFVADLDRPSAAKFLLENHLQGPVNSAVRLGLFCNDELLAVMTFGKSRFSKKYEWEMLRFCVKAGYHVPGGAGKLLKHFEKAYMPKSLVSYADRRWSQGGLYEKLGFTLDHASRPDYWYWNYKKSGFVLESRIKYQKHKLPKLLDKFDRSKTEIQNMNDNEYW